MLFISCGLIFPFLLLKVMISQQSIMQAQHYEINKYLLYDTIKKVYKQICLIVLFIFSVLIGKQYYFFMIIVSLVLVNVFFNNNQKIKYTARIKRFLLITFILFYILYFSGVIYSLLLMLLISNGILLYFLLVNFIEKTIQKFIISFYLMDAKKIVCNKTIIGITGSFGKTSCKNFIYDMLEGTCNISKTPKSYNTQVGIIKSIRDNIGEFDNYFICEYGVDKKGEMNKLLKIVKPNITLITEIGNQHLLTFKTIENIINEKMKLAKILKDNEKAVINNDNEYLKEQCKYLKCKVITYGIDNNSNVMAKNIEETSYGSSFDLFVNNRMVSKINVKLLGRHNILNVLGSIGVLISLNIDLNNIDTLVKNIKPVEHRLELKTIDNIRVIDDGFNANEKGFKNAIDTLLLIEGKKIIITPGIIEQGKNSESVNYKLGEYIANKLDYAILVGNAALFIKRGMKDKGCPCEKIIIKNNFLDAWEYLKSNIKSNNKIVLIENDIPSIYLK